jgi:hypothetical protein
LELYRDDDVECGVREVTPGEFDGKNVGFGQHMHVLTPILGKRRRGGVRGERGAVLPVFWGFGGHRRARPQRNYLNYPLVRGESFATLR